MVALGDLPGGAVTSHGNAISADGSAVVGYSISGLGMEAYRWRSPSGPMEPLGDLSGGDFESEAFAVSSDGSVVVGYSKSDSGKQAFRWTSGSGMVGLGDLAGGTFESWAYGVSSDGTVVVGHGNSGLGMDLGREAFRWTSGGGMVGLGDLPGGTYDSIAYGVSSDGSIIVGFGESASGREAFIWDAFNGMRSLRDVLLNDFGLDLAAWTLTKAEAISADGSTIVGYGTDPNGDTQAWIATIQVNQAPDVNGMIVEWGDDFYGQDLVPVGNDYIAISAGYSHGLALKSDGSLVGWGWNSDGQTSVPDGNDYIAIGAGGLHSLALKSDGSIVGWGHDFDGQASPPGGSDYIAIAAGRWHSLALKSDGNLVGWGMDNYGQATPPDGNDYIAIAAGQFHSLALKSDGNLVGWGYDSQGQASPPDGNDYIAIAAGGEHCLALKSDDSIVGWGDDFYGQSTVPDGNDYVAVAAGGNHSLALKSDGRIVGWGWDIEGESSPPDGNDYIAIAAGYDYSLALKQRSITVFVDVDAIGGNDGTSWANAYNYLQDALADPCALSAGQIWVADGTYTPDSNTSDPNGTGERTATFQLISGVTIEGGYAGYGAPYPNARDIQLYETILSGDLDANDVDVNDPCDLPTEPTRGENSYHVVTASGTEPNAVLDGFTITAGNANGSEPNINGGGMYNESGSPTVINSTFTGNSAASYAGGMYNSSSSPMVTNCAFSGNSASAGGGMENWTASSPTITNCTFSGNSAIYGGGMENFDSSPTVTNCTFTGNSAYWNGGGMENNNSSPTITNCILWGNTATDGNEIALFSLSTIDVNYCDIKDGNDGIYNDGTGTVNWGSGNIDADPCFVDPNGPDGTIGTEDDNLRLSAGSPCIDAADNNSVPNDAADLDNDANTAERTPLDLDYNQRFLDDPCTVDTGVPDPPAYPNVVDMGAYEYHYGTGTCWDTAVCAGQPTGDATCDGSVNLADLLALKASFGKSAPWTPPECCADFTQDGSVNLELSAIGKHVCWLT
jgi:probable HAF family extracellular repeat protein